MKFSCHHSRILISVFCFIFRATKDGTVWYLVKWRELPYDQATWEVDDGSIAELSQAIDNYFDLRFVMIYGLFVFVSKVLC